MPASADAADVSSGGSVEVFANAEDLQTRAQYVGNITKQPMFVEYDYTSASSLVFLRISGKLTPERANAYFAAAKAFMPDLVALK